MPTQRRDGRRGSLSLPRRAQRVETVIADIAMARFDPKRIANHRLGVVANDVGEELCWDVGAVACYCKETLE